MGADLEIEGFEQLSEIGRGGSARVFKAFQTDLDRIVAVKVLHSSWDSEVQQRFDRERRAMGRLSDHAGIVPIYATGETKTGEPYLVMPYYAKGSLADAMAGSDPMPWQRATALIAAVAETIKAAHDQGIIHCDIKPANIMLHDNGQPKIADFGISRTGGTVSITRQTAQTFTPAYSPPEVFVDSSREHTVDVYGMGATFFALLAGRPPFHGTGAKPNVMAIINRVAHQPLEDLRESVPAPICAFVERTMAKDPADRPQDVPAFLSELKVAVKAARTAGQTSASQPGTQPTSVTQPANRTRGIPVPLRSISVNRTIGPTPQPTAAVAGGVSKSRLASANTVVVAIIGTVLIGGLFAMWNLDSNSTAPAAENRSSTTATTSEVTPISEASTTSVPDASTTETPTSTSQTQDTDKPSSSGGSDAVLEPAAGPEDPATEQAPQSEAPVISALSVSAVSETAATITFKTTDCASSETRLNSREGTETLKSSSCLTSHSFVFDDLAPDTTYEVTVTANADGLSSSGGTSFTTPALDEPEPLSAPVLSDLRVISVTQTTAVVGFNTDLCATSVVVSIIGTDEINSCTQSHRFEIGASGTSLAPGTPYVVLVEATANELTTSSSLSFTTEQEPAPAPAKPEIVSISVEDITDTTARVVFTTDQCTGSVFTLSGGGGQERGYPNSNVCWITHRILLGDGGSTDPLTPGTSYTVTVTARTQAGTSSDSKTVSFETLSTPAEATTVPPNDVPSNDVPPNEVPSTDVSPPEVPSTDEAPTSSTPPTSPISPAAETTQL